MQKFFAALSLTAFAFGVSPAPALAQQTPAERTFAQLDADRDGKLSQSEFTAHPDLTTDQFSSWDSDGDKSISKAEFTANFGQ